MSTSILAQCDQLFISEYVEGYASNKALEIYNPTSAAINLSGFSIARFSNGSSVAPANKIIQLPNKMLQPHDVFVVVLDKQDMSLWNSDLDKPAWNGYNVVDTLFDLVTMEPRLDDDGNVIMGPQYDDDVNALFGDEYNEKYDLQCKADAFFCPVYNVNNTMYFNGNDAVALIIGTEVVDGSEILDVIGVIGEDPAGGAWVTDDMNMYDLTKDRTLVRSSEITTGRNAAADVIAGAGGTFHGEGWWSYPKNSFDFLGIHNSVCNTEVIPERFSCLTGPVTSVSGINEIPFKMYPNPNSTKELTIEAEADIQRVAIYNLLGQAVLQDRTATAGLNQTQIDLTKLGKGMYLVNLFFEDDKVSIQKLVVE